MVHSEGHPLIKSARCEIGQLIGSHALVTESVNWEDCQVKLAPQCYKHQLKLVISCLIYL